MNTKTYIKVIQFLFLSIYIGIIVACNQVSNQKAQLFAAAGTMLPSTEICDSILTDQSIEIEKNFAASGDLARQIKAGADADIYISANKQWINHLNENHLIIENSISEIAGNKLVVICPVNKDIILDFSTDFDIQSTVKDRISIGDPKYVPVGKYSKQVLDTLNWFNQIQNQIILAKDVTSVLHYVELGECDWGIVYYSEAIKSEKVRIAYEIPQKLYSPIKFYIARMNDNEKTVKCYNYFKSNIAEKIFLKYGFNK